MKVFNWLTRNCGGGGYQYTREGTITTSWRVFPGKFFCHETNSKTSLKTSRVKASQYTEHYLSILELIFWGWILAKLGGGGGGGGEAKIRRAAGPRLSGCTSMPKGSLWREAARKAGTWGRGTIPGMVRGNETAGLRPESAYWMSYREPGFLPVVWIGSSPTLSVPSPISKLDWRHTLRLRKRDNLLTGGGWARSRIIWP